MTTKTAKKKTAPKIPPCPPAPKIERADNPDMVLKIHREENPNFYNQFEFVVTVAHPKRGETITKYTIQQYNDGWFNIGKGMTTKIGRFGFIGIGNKRFRNMQDACGAIMAQIAIDSGMCPTETEIDVKAAKKHQDWQKRYGEKQ